MTTTFVRALLEFLSLAICCQTVFGLELWQGDPLMIPNAAEIAESYGQDGLCLYYAVTETAANFGMNNMFPRLTGMTTAEILSDDSTYSMRAFAESSMYHRYNVWEGLDRTDHEELILTNEILQHEGHSADGYGEYITNFVSDPSSWWDNVLFDGSVQALESFLGMGIDIMTDHDDNEQRPADVPQSSSKPLPSAAHQFQTLTREGARLDIDSEYEINAKKPQESVLMSEGEADSQIQAVELQSKEMQSYQPESLDSGVLDHDQIEGLALENDDEQIEGLEGAPECLREFPQGTIDQYECARGSATAESTGSENSSDSDSCTSNSQWNEAEQDQRRLYYWRRSTAPYERRIQIFRPRGSQHYVAMRHA